MSASEPIVPDRDPRFTGTYTLEEILCTLEEERSIWSEFEGSSQFEKQSQYFAVNAALCNLLAKFFNGNAHYRPETDK